MRSRERERFGSHSDAHAVHCPHSPTKQPAVVVPVDADVPFGVLVVMRVLAAVDVRRLVAAVDPVVEANKVRENSKTIEYVHRDSRLPPGTHAITMRVTFSGDCRSLVLSIVIWRLPTGTSGMSDWI